MSSAQRVRHVEGVPWRRYVVRYKLADGRRRTMVRWSAGPPWIGREVTRELNERHSADDLPPGSTVAITQEDL